MASPQSFPIVLLVTCFVMVVAAFVVAILLEAVGFKQRYRIRRGVSVEDVALPARAAVWMKQKKLLLRSPGRVKLRS